jgi:hypothetical protein
VGKDEETKRNDDNVPIAATCEVLSLTPETGPRSSWQPNRHALVLTEYGQSRRDRSHPPEKSGFEQVRD